MKKKALVPEVVTAFDPKTVAMGLTDQYNRTIQSVKASVQNVLKFGAMLIKTEQAVFAEGPARGNRFEKTSNGGLESWLAKHCPDINYKTAMRWKKIAENAIGGLGCDIENGVLLLTGNVDEVSPKLPLAEMKSRVDELYEAKSIRQLSQMCFDFASDEKDAKKSVRQRDFMMPTNEEAAKEIWTEIKIELENSVNVKAIANLDPEIASVMADVLKRLLKKFEARAFCGE